MADVLVNGAGLAVIVFIVWWFWLSRGTARRAEADTPLAIVVEDGVYLPARIEVDRERPIVLRFLRKDPSPCAAKVIFTELGVGTELPVGEERELRLEPLQPGEYEFVCEMRMYRGVLSVK